jgi:hypothetical protein
MRPSCRPIPVALLALSLTSCCISVPPPQQAEVRFPDPAAAPVFTRAYAIGSDSTRGIRLSRGFIALPLNLLTDSTGYVLRRSTGQLDTLLIRYRRELALNSGCDPQYYQRAVPGDVPRERQVKTTFGRVTNVAFDSRQSFYEILIEIQP